MNELAKLLLQRVCEENEDIRNYIINFNRGMAYLVDRRVMDAQSEFIKSSEMYRSEINKSTSLMDIAKLSIVCIGGMTGDQIFVKQNLKRIEMLADQELTVGHEASIHFGANRRMAN